MSASFNTPVKENKGQKNRQLSPIISVSASLGMNLSNPTSPTQDSTLRRRNSWPFYLEARQKRKVEIEPMQSKRRVRKEYADSQVSSTQLDSRSSSRRSGK